MKNSEKALLFARFIITARNEFNNINVQGFVDDYGITLSDLYRVVFSEGYTHLVALCWDYNMLSKNPYNTKEEIRNQFKLYYNLTEEEFEIILDAGKHVDELSSVKGVCARVYGDT